MKLTDITEGQFEVLAAIASSWRVRGRAPSHQEIVRITGRTSTYHLLYPLVVRGLLTSNWERGRQVEGTLRPTQQGWKLVDGESESEAAA